MAAVSRRVREFGTLKALGWRSRRIIGQVMGESVAMGIIGGAIGVGLGFAGAELVSKLSPPLTAVGGPDHRLGHAGRRQAVRRRRWRGGGAAASAAGPAAVAAGSGRRDRAAAHTVAVHLTAPVSRNIILLAVVLAVAGGLIAGIVRRLAGRPAAPGRGPGPKVA